MRKLILIVLASAIAVGAAFTAGDHAFVGVKKCKMCHKSEKNGLVFEKWEAGPHAKAFATLQSDSAKKISAGLKKSKPPHEDPDCLSCHITGFGAPDSLIASVVREDGVTCEACHGAGGDYWKKSVMEDRAKSISFGLTEKPKEVCVTCHNEKSPTYRAFDLDERWAKIAHGLPQGE